MLNICSLIPAQKHPLSTEQCVCVGVFLCICFLLLGGGHMKLFLNNEKTYLKAKSYLTFMHSYNTWDSEV